MGATSLVKVGRAADWAASGALTATTATVATIARETASRAQPFLKAAMVGLLASNTGTGRQLCQLRTAFSRAASSNAMPAAARRAARAPTSGRLGPRLREEPSAGAGPSPARS